jgi:hypothetical protein
MGRFIAIFEETQEEREAQIAIIEHNISPMLDIDNKAFENFDEAWCGCLRQNDALTNKGGQNPALWKEAWTKFHNVAQGVFDKWIGHELFEEGKKLSGADLYKLFDALEKLPATILGEDWETQFGDGVAKSIREDRSRREQAQGETPRQLLARRSEAGPEEILSRKAITRERLAALATHRLSTDGLLTYGLLQHESGAVSDMGSINEEDPDSPSTDSIKNSVAAEFSQLTPATMHTARGPYVPEGFPRSIGASLGSTGKLRETERLKSRCTVG